MNDSHPSASKATIFPGVGIKGVYVDSTMAEVVGVLGPPEKVAKFDGDLFFDQDPCVFYIYFSEGISIEFVSQKAKAIWLYSGIQAEIQTSKYTKCKGATPNGVTLDSTYEHVVKAYGPPEDKGELAFSGQTPITRLIYKSRGVEFTFVKGSGQMTYMCIYARVY